MGPVYHTTEFAMVLFEVCANRTILFWRQLRQIGVGTICVTPRSHSSKPAQSPPEGSVARLPDMVSKIENSPPRNTASSLLTPSRAHSVLYPPECNAPI